MAKLDRWRISRIVETRAKLIGYVKAPDEEEAIREAMKQFKIRDAEQQRRLVARRVDHP